ncbi:protein kinase domain-containing protein [Nocardia cerradoensis]|nr:protein kinase [Nocardia cerradoensis]
MNAAVTLPKETTYDFVSRRGGLILIGDTLGKSEGDRKRPAVRGPHRLECAAMIDDDPLRTRRDVSSSVADELTSSGFADAEEIGHGGFGVVYRCTQVELDRTVAVKVLTAELDNANRERFFREQRAMSRLTAHPNIVTVLQVGVTTGGLPYLVMPYHRFDSLDVRLRRDGVMPVEEVLWVGVKIAGALESAHRLGIVHRDVKPGNILLTDYGEPALTDFGIAHMEGGFRTATGVLTASPAFTAPEVLGGEAATAAADVYGLGATLFCGLTGHAAFERRSGEQVVAQFVRITSQPVPDLRESGIPGNVAEVVESAMNRDPSARPSAAELGDAIRRVQRQFGYHVDEMALQVGPRQESETTGAPEQVSWPKLVAAQAPQVRSGGSELPLELTSFVGRRSELAEVKNRLATSRLVTLAGTGGVGKTRLGLRVASNARRAFADGVWVVELADVRDPALLIDVVAGVLGLRDDSARPMEHMLVEFLRPRKALLLLDNGEQVVEALACLVERLLVACPNLRILVTSREPLDVAGETVVRVAPLEVPEPGSDPALRGLLKYDAVTLFSERAAAVVPGFEVTEDNKAAVAGICARLDGLPLAIELAAARMRTMSPEQIRVRLSDRFALLTRSSRNAPRRQQTLRWCIDWSYGLCTPVEQRLWARLSVFAGGFELEAAEYVCGTDFTAENVLDVLSSLVDKSIVIRSDSGVVRFRMLETVRDFGRDQLRESDEDQVLHRRHRDWCGRLVLDAENGWIGDQQLDWLARLEREQSNLRAALDFCFSEDREASAEAGLRTAAGLWMFWSFRGLFGEGRRWLDRALANPVRSSVSDCARALHANIVMAAVQGDLQPAADLVRTARVLIERDHTPMNQALIDFGEGVLELYRDKPDHAIGFLGRAVEVLSADRRGYLHVAALMFLGWAYAMRGDTRQAIRCHENLLTITQASGETLFRSTALWGLGVAEWREGQPTRAQELLQEALRLLRSVHSPVVAALGLEGLAWIVAERDSERAAVLMGAAENLLRSTSGVSIFFPDLSHLHDECEHIARRALGDRRFDAAVRRGQAMELRTGVAYALGESASSPRASSSRAPESALTNRERQVADLVARGLTDKQIAAKLVISQRTAQGHVQHILTKLGFTSRAQIAAWSTGRAQD